METNAITELVIPEDKNTICRFCLSISEDLILVKYSQEIEWPNVGKLSFSNVFKKLSIKIDDAEFLPKGICHDCKVILGDFLIYLEKVESNEEILKSVYSEDFIEPSDDEVTAKIEDVLPSENHIQFIEEEDNDMHWTLSQDSSSIINVDHAYGKKNESGDDEQSDDDDELSDENNEFEQNDLIKTEFGNFTQFSSLPNPDAEFRIVDIKQEVSPGEELKISPKASTSQEYKNMDTAFENYKVYNTSSNVVKITVLDRNRPIENFIKLTPVKKTRRRLLIKRRNIRPSDREQPEPFCIKQCFFCTRKFSSDGLRILHYVEHVVQATEDLVAHRPFCKYCGLLTTNKEDLDNHIETKHDDEDELNCQECEIKFCNIREVTKHKQKSHIEDYEEEVSELNKCPICEKIFNSIDDLIKHALTHISRRYTCMTCKQIYVCDAALNEHHKEHPQYKYKCPICKRLASGKRGLDAHIGTHNTTRNYECDVCGKKYKTKNHLLYHRGIHFKPNLICAHCAYSTPSSKDFAMHVRVHSDERPFQCTFKDCGKAYKTNSALSEHVKQHLKIKEFSCDMCDYKTSRSVGLTIHKRKHTGERPYVCMFCLKTFNRQWSLTLHMRKLHNVLQEKSKSGELD